MISVSYSPLCGHIVGHDERGGGICCGKPRCEEAGRRRLCREHWQALQRDRKQLVWIDRGDGSLGRMWTANAARHIGGDYHIRQRESARFGVHYRAKAIRGGTGRTEWFDDVDTLEQAKAVCQSHYDVQLNEAGQ